MESGLQTLSFPKSLPYIGAWNSAFKGRGLLVTFPIAVIKHPAKATEGRNRCFPVLPWWGRCDCCRSMKQWVELHPQEAETMECWCPAGFLLFIQSGRLSPWDDDAHIQGGSSHLN